MRYVIAAILIIIICSVIFAVARKAARKAEKQIDPNDFIIRQPKLSLKLYIFVTVFFSLICFAIIMSELTEGHAKNLPRLILSFSPFMALGPFLIIIWHRWKITVKGNMITACSYFGKGKTFTFDYITKVQYGVNTTKMGKIEFHAAYHDKEKLFTVSEICPGYKALVERLNNRNEA
jgi:hypothetical protein